MVLTVFPLLRIYVPQKKRKIDLLQPNPSFPLSAGSHLQGREYGIRIRDHSKIGELFALGFELVGTYKMLIQGSPINSHKDYDQKCFRR